MKNYIDSIISILNIGNVRVNECLRVYTLLEQLFFLYILGRPAQ